MTEKVESEALVGKKAELVALVNYQKASVVSRTLIDKDKGTVTLFAFDKGQGLSEHTAPYDALVHILDGEADVVISSRAQRALLSAILDSVADTTTLPLQGG